MPPKPLYCVADITIDVGMITASHNPSCHVLTSYL